MMKNAARAAEETGHDTTPESKRGPRRDTRDRRLTANLNLYWYSLRETREPPAFAMFDPTLIPALWRACLLAERDDSSGLFHLADLGSALASDSPALAPGLAVDVVPRNTLAGRALSCLAGAVGTRDAVSLEDRFRHQNGIEMLYRAIGLPFLDVRGRLTYVVCAISGKTI